MKKQEPYILLDIQGLLQKFYHAGNDPDALVDDDSNSVNTGEYGVARFIEMQLLNILDMVPPRRIIAVWDGGNDYRRGIFPNYKKKRKETVYTKTQIAQKERLFDLSKKALASLGVLQAKCARAEADDVIALLCDRLKGHKVVYTIDADLLQLANETTSVMLDGIEIEDEHKGVPLNLIRLNKALVGDTSDEYGGVFGFGAGKWDGMVELFDFDGMKQVEECIINDDKSLLLQAHEETNNKGCELILKGWNDAKLCYHLASLHPDICEGNYNGKLQEIVWYKRLPNSAKLKKWLDEAGIGNLHHRFFKFMPTQTLVTADNINILREVKEQLKITPFVGFDYESFDAEPHQPFKEASKSSPREFVDMSAQVPTGASFTYGENLQHTIYISVQHKDTNNAHVDSIKWMLNEIEEAGLELIIQNTQFELCLSDLQLGINLKNTVDTTNDVLALEEDLLSGLKDQSKRHLGYAQVSYKEVVGDKGHMANLTGEEVLGYGCDDALCAAHLHDYYLVRLQIEGLDEFLKEFEYETNEAFYNIYREGVRIDWERLNVMREEDATEAASNDKILRDLLAENCTDISEKRMGELYAELAAFSEARLRDKYKEEDASDKHVEGKTDDIVKKALENLKESMLAATQYVPYKEVVREVNFKPTPTMLSKVAEALGLPEIEKVTKTYITAWVFDNQEAEFASKLAAAAHQLRAREGEEYEALSEFCCNILKDDSKIDKLGDELNFDSPTQMQRLLYTKLDLPIRVRSKKQRKSSRELLGFEGSPATDDAAINMALAEDCPEGDWRRQALRALQAAKSCLTRESLYWSKYPLWKHPADGNVHGQLKNMGTVTRRPSGTSPNFLQLTGKDGGRVRSMILPLQEGHVIISPDYNGEELRYVASMSKDQVMIDAYIGETRRDIHSLTASAIAPVQLRRDNPEVLERLTIQSDGGLLYEDFVEGLKGTDGSVLNAIRKIAKSINFLLIYAGGPMTLAKKLGISMDLAKAFMEMVFSRYPRLKPWQQESIAFARDHGYVLTAWGNRRHLPDILSTDNAIRAACERQAINAPVQGTGADQLKQAIKAVRTSGILEDTGSYIMVPPYDEIALSVPREHIIEVSNTVLDLMKITPPGHIVPQVPELKLSAKNWGDVGNHELGPNPTAAQILKAIEV